MRLAESNKSDINLIEIFLNKSLEHSLAENWQYVVTLLYLFLEIACFRFNTQNVSEI